MDEVIKSDTAKTEAGPSTGGMIGLDEVIKSDTAKMEARTQQQKKLATARVQAGHLLGLHDTLRYDANDAKDTNLSTFLGA